MATPEVGFYSLGGRFSLLKGALTNEGDRFDPNSLGGKRDAVPNYQAGYGVHFHEEERLLIQRRTMSHYRGTMRGLPADYGIFHWEILYVLH